MREKMIVKTPDQMKALSDARRLELLKRLVEAPMSPSELGEALGESRRALYYHIGELEKHGLIEVVETRQRRNLMEKVYRATAMFYAVDWTLFQPDELNEAFVSSVTSVLESAAFELNKLVKSDSWTPEVMERSIHSHRMLAIAPEQEEEFRQRLAQLYEDFAPDLETTPQEHRVVLTVVMTPQAREPSKS